MAGVAGWCRTDELLVADVQGHVAEGRGHGADHAVVVHPQELHQDGQTLLLTHRRADVRRKLLTHTHTDTHRHTNTRTHIGERHRLKVKALKGKSKEPLNVWEMRCKLV